MRGEFLIVIEKADDGDYYFAYCPEVIGAKAEDKTIEGCRERMREAIKSVLDQRLEAGLREAPPDAVRETVVVESVLPESEVYHER